MDISKFSLTTLAVIALAGAVVTPALAQNGITHSYQIAPGMLSQALLQFSTQSSIQLIAPTDLTNGIHSDGLTGSYDTADALARLLAGKGLGYRLDSKRNTLTLYQLENVAAGNQLDAVQVEGWQSQTSGGANGSTDVTATEGTGSYSTTAIRIGSKSPQSVRETPQSVSVLTSQQLKDQNITDLNGAMAKSTGITVQQNSSGEQFFYSRGWQITSVQIDGGTPFKIYDEKGSAARPLLDMSIYDHVELLRGGDGLNSIGSSSPSGSINLARKRPLDHNQLTLDASAGSWSNYRTSLDASGPLAFDGRMRGRAVVTWQDKDYFFDTASDSSKVVYGIIDADMTPGTVLSVGATWTRKEGTPWKAGLPRSKNGADLRLPRSTSYVLPWSHMALESNDQFVQLEQRLGDNWDITGKLTRIAQTYGQYDGSVVGAVADVTSNTDIRTVRIDTSSEESRQWLANLNLNGQFNVYDLPQKLSVAASYQKNSYHNNIYDNLDVDNSSPGLPQPDWVPSGRSETRYIQSNLVAKVDSTFLPFLPDLHFQTAVRWDRNRMDRITTYKGSSIPPVKSDESRSSIPYYALRYDLTPEWSVYGSLTRLYEYQGNLQTVDRVPLPAMTGSTKEVGIKFNRGSLNSSLAAYSSTRTNLATGEFDTRCSPTSFCSWITSGEEKSEGFDFEINGEPLPRWSVNVGYTFNINKSRPVNNPEQQQQLSTITPKHLFKLWNNIRLQGNPWLNRTQLGLGIIAQTRSFITGSACTGHEGSSTCNTTSVVNYSQGFYSVVSSRASYALDDNWMLAVNLNNVFDRRYYATTGGTDDGNWYGEPRNVMFTVNGKF